MAAAMTEGKPTLHHLNNSQSQRILWLLEELHIDYNLKLYTRHKSGPQEARAPDELKKTNTMGKSPQLETSSGRVIIESSAIASYLISTYDKPNRFKGDPSTGNDTIRDEILTSFANASLGPVTAIAMLVELLVTQSPFFIRWLFKSVRSNVKKRYTIGEYTKALEYLENELGEQDYFMGENPGRADFMLSWPMDQIDQWGFAEIAKYPKLNAWYSRCHARDAWKRSLERGNGYDLVVGT